MVQFVKTILLLTVLLFVSACTQTETVEQIDDGTTEKKERDHHDVDIQEETLLTVEDILTRSLTEFQSIESLSSNKKVVQDIQLPNEDPLSTTTSLYAEMTQTPLTMYQKRVSTIPTMGDFVTDIYLVDEGVYFKDGLEDGWFTYPEDVAEELIAYEETTARPQEQQLELMSKYTDQLTYEETETHYVISFMGTSDVLTAFSLELNHLMLDELANELEEFMMMADINKLEYTVFIEKETFLQTEWNMSLQLELPLEEESITREINASEHLDHFNEITEIIVPLEVIQNAKEFNLHLSEFEELKQFDISHTHNDDPLTFY
ncbi:hypothetical protein JCM9140_2622 [Halalkalibacter wakoensis JCM 9140]|uniref:Lipoprotein n=1 Tax=Halalkalibacter wakoensis JCM 9140 TaxID=1236970 RepID=W4Q3I6_9BACI|nr:DUF6612 family protein [Halalkalibacter wakoensis]GAE26542.1 hypothetical protein JCM9140_2622 [Halalkalibacter wakoensis JCM 9140]